MSALAVVIVVSVVSLYAATRVQRYRTDREDEQNWNDDEGPFWASLRRDQ
jgi:hypothetical protein